MLLYGLATGAICLVLALLHAFRQRVGMRSGQRLPPGPRGLPVLGNLFDIPTATPWIAFQKWGNEYGPVVSMNVLGQRAIILNTLKAANDVMGKKASTAGRPRLVMAGDLVGFGRMAVLTSDMALHKEYRRLFTAALNSRMVKSYRAIQTLEARKLLTRLPGSPERLSNHLLRAVLGTVLLAIYGYEITTDDDRFAWLAIKNVKNFLITMTPGAFLVDVFPILRFVPAWLPGASFQRKATVWRQEFIDLLEQPFHRVKKGMADGTARPCFTTQLLEKDGKIIQDPAEQELIKWSAAVVVAGAAETTNTALETFFLAMVAYPAVQAKVQAELDRVVGRDRMPTLEDKESCVYLAAVIHECQRWHPVAPLLVPHAMLEDDVYEGYVLPKGFTVMTNAWAIFHDPDLYESPDDFIPERFLSPDGLRLQSPQKAPNFSSLGFGLGRRVCLGMELAEETLFIVGASTLWTYNLLQPIGPDGKRIAPKLEWQPGLSQHPKPFKYDVKPRFEGVVEILNESVVDAAGAAL